MVHAASGSHKPTNLSQSAVFPKGLRFDAPVARGLWWAPFNLYKAPVCIKPLQPPWRAREKISPFGGWRHHLRPVGKRVTGFSVAQGLPMNPVPLPPRKRWDNKASRDYYLKGGTMHSTGCCAPAQRGKGGAVRHQRGRSHRRRLITVMLFITYEIKGRHRADFPLRGKWCAAPIGVYFHGPKPGCLVFHLHLFSMVLFSCIFF